MSPVWRVDVDRQMTTDFYVEADSREAAQEAADELANDLHGSDFTDFDTGVFVRQVDVPPEGEFVWSEGKGWTSP